MPGVYSPSPSPASRCPLPAREGIDIVGFVDAGDVDLLLYDRGCYAAPDGPAAIRPYALLGEARAGAFGAAKPAARTRGAVSWSYRRCGGHRRSATLPTSTSPSFTMTTAPPEP